MSDVLRQWSQAESPRYLRITLPNAGQIVPTITRILFSHGRIIAASDTAPIYVYSPDTGRLCHTLNGHQGGVWALEAIDDMLVSGSVDKTIRVWDLHSWRCTHVFAGHQNTIRCLKIIKPSWNLHRDPETQVERREWWPARPYVVSGSRDCTVRLWALPRIGDESMSFDNTKRNPYHKMHLKGHEESVKDIAARGRIAVSASHDNTLRVWDLVKGICRFVLRGHIERVQCVAIDPIRPQAYSGSADTSIRVWNTFTGECVYVLTGHSDIIGVLSISETYLVSAAADEIIRVWNPDTGVMLYAVIGGTTVYNDEAGLLCGSTKTGIIQLRKMVDGSTFHEFKGPGKGCWSTLFHGPYCMSAGSEETLAVLDIWQFASAQGAPALSDDMEVEHNN